MNLKNFHPENKAIQINVLFEATEKVLSIQIAKGEQLHDHISKIPALLVCVLGDAVYNDENGTVTTLKPGGYVFIKPNVKHWINAIELSNFLLIK